MSSLEESGPAVSSAQTSRLGVNRAASATGNYRSSRGTLIAGIIAGITASACCVGPLVLLMLGISGSWISNLTALEPYRPIFIGMTLLFLGLAFRKLYLVPQRCAVYAPCVRPANLRRQRIAFWLVSVAVLLLIAFPWYGSFFIK